MRVSHPGHAAEENSTTETEGKVRDLSQKKGGPEEMEKFLSDDSMPPGTFAVRQPSDQDI